MGEGHVDRGHRLLRAGQRASQAHFIRCIKPNPELVPKKIHGEQVISHDLTLTTHRYSQQLTPHVTTHGEQVISQLRQSGMLDAVKLIQAGYPTRIPYESIHSRYKDIIRPYLGLSDARSCG